MARRQARRREAGRCWRPWSRLAWIGGGAMLLGAIAAAGAALGDAQTWPLRQLRVEGRLEKVDEQTLRAIVAARAAQGFFGLDVAELKADLETLAWVEQASVRRIWPDTLAVRLREQMPVARWADGGLVNVRGELFHPPPDSYPPALPVLAGPSGTQAQVAVGYAQMARLLEQLGLRATRVGMDERGAWRLALAQGPELILGRRDTQARLLRFVHVYPSVFGERVGQAQRVDLRYGHGMAVQWKAEANVQQG